MTGHIRRRGKRSWAIIVEIEADASGKRRQKWHTVRGTRKDAERERNRLVNEINTGLYVEPAHLTVEEYLEKWLDSSAKIKVSGKTFERYAEIVRTQLIPELGALPLQKLTPLKIQDCYAKALTNGRLSVNREARQTKNDAQPTTQGESQAPTVETGLSDMTVLHHHRVLRTALQQAVKWQLLARNPADAVDPPKPQPKEMCAIDGDQMAFLLEVEKQTRFYIPVLLAITTGMRRGEFLGLQWPDVNLIARTAAVRRSIEQTKAGIRMKPPKGKRGRKIDLPALTVEALVNHRVAQEAQKKALGDLYQNSDLVCANEDGTLWKPNTFSVQFGRIAKKLGWKGVRLHDMRHSHATQLLQQGVHPKIVSERLGHSTVAITLDTYSHVLPGMQEDAAQKVDTVLTAAIIKERARKPS